jgi:hypothetical protein
MAANTVKASDTDIRIVVRITLSPLLEGSSDYCGSVAVTLDFTIGGGFPLACQCLGRRRIEPHRQIVRALIRGEVVPQTIDNRTRQPAGADDLGKVLPRIDAMPGVGRCLSGRSCIGLRPIARRPPLRAVTLIGFTGLSHYQSMGYCVGHHECLPR